MSVRSLLKAAALIAALLAGTAQFASAQDKIRVGVIGPFSGPFATAGVQFRQGVETYQALNGTRAGNREIEVIFRDTGGANPAVARRLAEELILKDKVSILGGFYLSPEATATASVVTETKTPTVLFNTASPPIPTRSPYFVRVGTNSWQNVNPTAEWAYAKGMRRAYIAVADYAPGHDSEEVFRKRFTALGGQIIGADRIPLNTVDYAPFAERILAAKPEVVSMFIPGGTPAINFVKALAARGGIGKDITIIGQAETDDPDLKQFDRSVIGIYTSICYALGVPGEANKKFKQALQAKFGAGAVPNYAMVGAFDGMRVIYRMVEAQKGKAFDPDEAIAAVRGYAWESPRGPVKIEADTRDITQNIYLRRTEDVGGHLENVIVETFRAVKYVE